MNWYVFEANPRQESCALLSLQNQDYLYDLPALQQAEVLARTLARVMLRLFSRDLFFELSSECRASSMNLLTTS
jgi:hypothetical protein